MYKICLRIPIDFPKKETARNTNNIDDLGGFDFTQLIDYKSLSYPYSGRYHHHHFVWFVYNTNAPTLFALQ